MFKDLPKDHWAYKDIMEFAEKGIVTGYPDGTIKPDEYITRAEAFAIYSRYNERK